ncbi:MAG: hypothetical protein R2737_10815 [Candidatus Nanopelagicales bacterium]
MGIDGAAPRGPAGITPRAWLRTALLAALGLLVITPLAVAFGITFGLISGLIVLMIPAYVVLVWLVATTVTVALCMWREHPALARALGTVVALGPAVTAVVLYARASLNCRGAVDERACYDYLNGSPLLPILVGLSVVVALAAAVAVWAATAARRASPV